MDSPPKAASNGKKGADMRRLGSTASSHQPHAADEARGLAVYEGALLKKPTNLSAYLSWTGWRSRYCVADDTALVYFARRGDTNPRARYEFEHCKIVPRGRVDQGGDERHNGEALYAFDVVYKGQVASFASKSKKNYDRWAEVLELKTRRAALKKNKERIAHHRSSEWRRLEEVDRVLREDSSSVNSANDFDDDVNDNATEYDSEEERREKSRRPLYGPSAPSGFRAAREIRLSPTACFSYELWTLMRHDSRGGECEEAGRFFELQNVYAGNSGTDINGLVAELGGPLELKCVASVAARPIHAFAMMMDLSAARKDWDPSFDCAQIIETVDAHNDIVALRFLPLFHHALTKSRAAKLRRYWCRETNGTYIIYYQACPIDSSDSDRRVFRGGAVLADVALMYVTISPVATNIRSLHDTGCTVTVGISADLGGWATFLKPFARSLLLQVVRSAEQLKRLAQVNPPLVWDTENRVPAQEFDRLTDFPFHGRFKQALLEALSSLPQLDEGVREEERAETGSDKESTLDCLEDPCFLVNFCRKSVETLRELTPQEQAVARARALLTKQNAAKADAAAAKSGGSNLKQGAQQHSVVVDSKGDGDQRKGKEQPQIGTAFNNADPVAPRLNYDYAVPRSTVVLPMSISKEGISAWSDSGVEEGYWKVRGPNYLVDKIKVPNKVSAMELVQAQWSFYSEPKRNIAKDPSELVQLEHEGRSDRPYMVICNFMVPTIGNFAIYSCKRRGVDYPVFDQMLADFIAGDDDYRNGRFKIIPSVVEGSWVAKKGIGSTPAILGKKLRTDYFFGDNWMEICIDVGSSRVAGKLMGLVKTYAASLVLDLAFLFESQSPEELPETIMCGARMYQAKMGPVDEEVLVGLAKSKEILNNAYSITAAPKEEDVYRSEAPQDEGKVDAAAIHDGAIETEPSEETAPVATSISSLTPAEDSSAEVTFAAPPSPKVDRSDNADRSDNDNTPSISLATTAAAAAIAAPPTSPEESNKATQMREANKTLSTNAPDIAPDLNYVYEAPQRNNVVKFEQDGIDPKSIQQGKTTGKQNSAWWDSGTDIGYWKLRGRNYLIDRIKVPCNVSAMELVQMQWTRNAAGPKRHICADPDELVQKQHQGRIDRPFLFVVNIMIENNNCVLYFARRRGQHYATFERMLRRFISPDTSDEYRNARFKIIPSVVEGYFVVCRAIGSKPAILGKKMKIEYFRGDNYFEVCVNASNNPLADRLFGVVKSYASSLVIDLAFLFESKTEDELPEVLLGGTRVMHPNFVFPRR